jgi:3-oxoadipate enol-lactonase/4-carboxymuconolactone decarboxylase
MIPTLTAVPLAGSPGLPLLVAGPSLGTSVETLWSPCAALLGDRFQVIGWDLPGHGRSEPPTAPFTIAEIAEAVRSLFRSTPFSYAGNSIGGAVGLALLLKAPDQVTHAGLICTAAKIGTPTGWHDRAATVRASGTSAVIEGSAQRWFAPGFLDHSPATASALLHALRDTDAESYALTCEALADFDVRDRLGEITTPVLAIAGAHDMATPPADLEQIATGVQQGRLTILGDAAHLGPAERPSEVAALLLAAFS